MDRSHTIAGTPEVGLAIRVRGLSRQQRYFDERVMTTHITKDFIVVRLRDQVDLDTEVHVMNMHTRVGGNYRVAWINTCPDQGWYAVGLELLEAEGLIWEPDSIPQGPEAEFEPPTALLECERCHQKTSTLVPEAEIQSLGEGFTIARHCEKCKGTTSWLYCVEKSPAAMAAPHAPRPGEAIPAEASTLGSAGPMKDHRKKGRAPIRLTIKVIRTKYGINFFDVCDTINVSRTGVYFMTEQGYEVGEEVAVVVPYHPNSMAIPVPARVVRQDERRGTYAKYVAVQLTSGTTTKP